ncbi:MAG: AcrR family transcriptional regulator [Yoonia sp.]|jgi:AcrR family transcriptional regulator
MHVTDDAKTQQKESVEAILEPNRRTQHQRSSETIERLSQATIALMTEVGFVNMTTTSIAARAGVSRGAMLHHFSNKVALVTYATGEMWRGVVDYTDDLRCQSDPENCDPEGFVEALWAGAMAKSHVSVSVDMMLAANGNPVLQAHLDKWVARMFDSYRAAGRYAFGQAGLSLAECDALIATVASTLRGQRVAQMLAPDPAAAKAVRSMLAKLLRDQLKRNAQ